MKLYKLAFLTIGVAVLLGVLVASAPARIFTLSNNFFRAQYSTVTFSGLFGNFSCPMTLEGSLHARTLAKVANTLVGYITAAALGACLEGTGTILRETLPWHMRYGGFSGALPNINNIRANVTGASVRIRESAGITCLERSVVTSPITITFGRSIATRDIYEAPFEGTIPNDCGGTARVESDRGQVTLLNATNRITVTLI
jgi:hypothetical protein